MIAEIAGQLLSSRKQVVVLCHRREILDQICSTMRRHLGIAPERVEAGCVAQLEAPLLVGMVPTMRRRVGQLGAAGGCALIADEAHHMGSTSWRAVRDALRPSSVCGFTATPIRPDGYGLSTEDWDELVLGPEVRELIEAGALTPYRMFASPHAISTEGIRTRAGDYEMDEMARRAQTLSGSIVGDWCRYNPDGYSTISVGVTVEHAEEIARIYRAAGVKAVCVTGESSSSFREDSFAGFRAGEIQVVTSCALIDEGLDVPSATCLQLLRPTQSIRLHRQLIGRVMRPHPGKDSALILDHTDNWRRLPLPDEPIAWQLDEPYEPEERERGEAQVDPVTQEVQEGLPLMRETTRLEEITAETALARRVESPQVKLRRERNEMMQDWLASFRR
jgi:superfamily II DNA or RNA helicase